MKRLALLMIVCLWHTPIFAQTKAINKDSLVYEMQRQKINAMLDARHRKFGQYDQSLKKHTGIFGLQTKKDIRRSNDILMDIARTDDSIFIQTKVLLDLRNNQLTARAFQQQQAEQKSTVNEDHSLAYMNTINRLREQTDKMRLEQFAAESHYRNTIRVLYFVIVLMLGSILFLLFRRKRVVA
jgi:hypothetical protein